MIKCSQNITGNYIPENKYIEGVNLENFIFAVDICVVILLIIFIELLER